MPQSDALIKHSGRKPIIRAGVKTSIICSIFSRNDMFFVSVIFCKDNRYFPPPAVSPLTKYLLKNG